MFQCIHLLTETGDKLITELGDFIVISCSAIPVPVPVPVGGGGQDDYYERQAWERQRKLRIETQNYDDFQVVRILTEFLSRM